MTKLVFKIQLQIINNDLNEIIKIILGAVAAVVVLGVTFYVVVLSQNISYDSVPKELDFSIEGTLFGIDLSLTSELVNSEEAKIIERKLDFKLDPDFTSLYDEIGILNNPQNSIVVYPTFTEAAYSERGFYDFYRGECDNSCLTVPILNDFSGGYTSSRVAFQVLTLLGYSYITDVEIDKNPRILDKFDKVILLHNEYVTKNEFDSITNHPKVLYLYPNSLYAEVVSNYTSNTVTLIRGHSYPTSDIVNGFDWKYDNTHPFEFDNNCKNWEFYEIENGIMLNCYPENTIFKDKELLKAIKDF